MANLKPDAGLDALLGTEHLARDLRGRSVRGGVVIMSVQAAQFVLSLASTAILARLLAPGDFGLVAMSAAVGNFPALFLDLGLGSATVQRADLTRSQVSSLFWINTALGLLLSALLAGLAPLVARFYGQPQLVGVTMALALGFMLGGLSIQPNALLRRQMRFASLAGIELVSLILGIGAAVTSAALGAGYWALVYLTLVQQTASAAITWLVCGWRPSLPASSAGVRPLLSFGAGLTAFNILNYLVRNLDNIIIGRVVGTAALGLYLKSYSLLLVPVDRIRGPVSSVVVPALSRLQGDRPRFRSSFLKAVTAVAAVGMPVVVFLFVFAEDAVLLILGPQWRESVVLFRALAPAAFVETFNTVGSWACTPFGQSGRLVRWQMFATAVTVASFLIGVHWGALGVAVAFSVSTIALRLPAILYLLRDSPVHPMDLLGPLARPAFASIAAGAIIFGLRTALSLTRGGALVLLGAAPVFGALYFTTWLALPGGRRAVRELLGLFRDVFPRPTDS
jgi:O-antigen/teichoic acid export membrane protein